jgi:hypothetical protein
MEIDNMTNIEAFYFVSDALKHVWTFVPRCNTHTELHDVAPAIQALETALHELREDLRRSKFVVISEHYVRGCWQTVEREYPRLDLALYAQVTYGGRLEQRP